MLAATGATNSFLVQSYYWGLACTETRPVYTCKESFSRKALSASLSQIQHPMRGSRPPNLLVIRSEGCVRQIESEIERWSHFSLCQHLRGI